MTDRPDANPPHHSGRRRLIARGLATLATSLVAAGTLVAITAAPAQAFDSTTLAQAAAGTKRYIGTAVKANLLDANELNQNPTTQYTDILAREFNSITPENELKASVLRPSGNTYNWTGADEIVNFGYNRGWKVRGHTLAWHNQQGFMQNLTGSTLRTALAGHIQTVMQRYAGKIYAWDVVNEAFADGCSRTTTPACPRRTSNLQSSGNDWIEFAFTEARKWDSNAKLCYNDYDIENWDQAKTRAVYALVQDLKSKGLIDCVGFQAHFNQRPHQDGNQPGLSRFSFDKFLTTLQNFAALGVDVQITELDVEAPLNYSTVYGQASYACLQVDRCTGITTWGFRDADSWRYNDGVRLLFNGSTKNAQYDEMLGWLDYGDCASTATWNNNIPDNGFTYDWQWIGFCSTTGPGTSSLSYRIVHPRIADLRVELVAPDGTTYLVRNRVAGTSGTTYTYTFTPSNSSTNRNGYWVIYVYDQVSGQSGTLTSWTISL